jgi:AraC-like DNA-binding protein
MGALLTHQGDNAGMTEQENTSAELVEYRRSTALPGVEVLEVRQSAREWRVIPDSFAVVVFRTWQGRARTRGQVHSAEPGLAFCNRPGELTMGDPHAAGSFDVLQLQPEILEQWLAEQQSSSVRPDWSAVMKPISEPLRRHFAGFFGTFRPAASAMQVQSQLLELSEVMIGELIQGARQPRPTAGPPTRGAARMRECLNEEGLHVDLDTLAKRAGLSRFQALRTFKQRYGLPPHAYQLCLRMNHARRWLLEGASAADVAVRCGFADQSHFNRHFKRFHGVTPMQYALAQKPASRRASGSRRRPSDPSAIVARSDR